MQMKGSANFLTNELEKSKQEYEYDAQKKMPH